MDLKNGATVKLGAAEKADLTLIVTDDNFVALGSGKLNPQSAFMKGQLKVCPSRHSLLLPCASQIRPLLFSFIGIF